MKNFGQIQKVLLGSVSALVLTAVATPVFAQSSDTIETVVVTARRAAIESAQKIKENSDQIVDAIVADDAGKLPDNSVTEVLARVPGVTIGRFMSGDPDHYFIEGSGVAVRGLSQIASTLNGRSSFSASGGRALLWEDVAPELMAAVSVYKSSTADQIEGGIGGSVDLRTHMPFDYDKAEFNGSVGANYGDFRKSVRPQGSALYTNRWTTRIGEIGLLLSASYSDIASRYDTFQMEPYFQQTLYDGHTAFTPGGYDWRDQTYNRQRVGMYEALEWKPTDRLTIYQTAFESTYHELGTWNAVYVAADNSMQVANGAAYTLDARHGLTSAASFHYVVPTWQGSEIAQLTAHESCPVTDCVLDQVNPGASNGNKRTADLTEGFKWDATDRLYAEGAVQYVHSIANAQMLSVQLHGEMPTFGVQMNGDALPTITVQHSNVMAQFDRYVFEATQDTNTRDNGDQLAANVDAKYTLPDNRFVRAIKFGVRYANLKESDGFHPNWWSTMCGWNWSVCKYEGSSATTPASADISLHLFTDYFRGKGFAPAPIPMPTQAVVQMFNNSYIHQQYGVAGDGTSTDFQANAAVTPMDITRSKTVTQAAYVMADFAYDNVLGMPMNGNIGVRVVNDHNSSFSFGWQNSQTVVISGHTYVVPSGSVPRSGGRHYTKILPSLNVQVMPRDDIHVRLALTQTMSNPTFDQLAANYTTWLQLCAGNVFDPTGACLSPGQAQLTSDHGGNPTLKPQVSSNVDLSLEWYGANQATAHIAAFYKNISNLMEWGKDNTILPYTTPDGVARNLTFQSSGWYNAVGASTIRGFEIGGTKFFDFLPSPLDGLGVDANFTYIDSSSPGSKACQLFALQPGVTGNATCGSYQPINGLPIPQLSTYNYNLTGMYEKDRWSVRVSWNWRSKYLVAPNGNGTKTLPVFSAPYGAMDFGVQYKITDELSASFEGQNILDTVARTLDGVTNDPTFGNQQYNRNWYVSDRRFVATLKFAF